MMEGFESKEAAIDDAVLEIVANGGQLVIVHQDQPADEPYREHDLEHGRSCWCRPDVFAVGR